MKKIFRDLLKDLEEFDRTPEGWSCDLRLDLADIIIRHLAEKSWTQAKLAEAAGMKQPALTRILHSDANCTFETAGRVLFALGVKGKLVEERAVAGSKLNRSEMEKKPRPKHRAIR